MSKRKHYADDTKMKDAAVFILMPIVAWFCLFGFVYVMAYVTR